MVGLVPNRNHRTLTIQPFNHLAIVDNFLLLIFCFNMLAVISDSHDNLVNLDKAIAFANSNQAEAIIHCGDLCSSETLKHFAKAWTKPIYLVQGNGEYYDITELKKYPNIINLGRTGAIFEFKNIKIGVCHEPRLFEKLLFSEPDYIFYGHTHKPWEENYGKTRIINPGNLDGSRYMATLAIFEPSNGDLKLQLISTL